MTNPLATDKGILYIIATPIGNREDITLRALNLLKSVDFILAEDTRHSLPLLTVLGITNRLIPLHAHNEHGKSNQVIEQLLMGQSAALISDAGTPLISDPGFTLVRLAREHQIKVVPVPGACALITALSAAGVPCDAFLFLGFLPSKQKARINQLESLKTEAYTLIFYESTHRIMESLEDLGNTFGWDCEMVLAKELTKSFERFVPGTILEVKQWLLADPAHLKGEFVLLVPPRPAVKEEGFCETLLLALLKELPLKKAVSIVCTVTKANKNAVYETALRLKG